MESNKLYVGNLPYSVTDDSLNELFASFGEVTEAKVVIDKFSGRSKGFGFVTMADEATAQKAIAEMNDKEVDGRTIVVNVAKPKEARPNRY